MAGALAGYISDLGRAMTDLYQPHVELVERTVVKNIAAAAHLPDRAVQRVRAGPRAGGAPQALYGAVATYSS
jgi:hypothetical protein